MTARNRVAWVSSVAALLIGCASDDDVTATDVTESRADEAADDDEVVDADDDAADDDAADDDAVGADDDSSSPSSAEPEDTVIFGGSPPPVMVEEEPVASEPTEEPEEPAQAPLVSCAVAVGSGDGWLIDDMEDTNLDSLAQDGRAASWFFYDDDTGGTHNLLMDPTPEPLISSGHAVHVVGGGFTEWGSGFGVGMRWDGPEGERCVYDASAYSGIRFWARGNDVDVRLIATNPVIIPVSEGGTCEVDCWDNHGAAFTAASEWTEIYVPFTDLAQRWTTPLVAFDATGIFTVEFTLDAALDYDIWIDDLGFYAEGEEHPAYSPDLPSAE